MPNTTTGHKVGDLAGWVWDALGWFNSDDRFGGGQIRTADGPEGAAWEVAGRLGGHPGTHDLPSIARDINAGIAKGMSLDEAKDYARDNAVTRETTTAFGRLLETDDSDDLTRDLGRRLGLL